DLPAALGLGRVDLARRFFRADLRLTNATDAQLRDGFSLACAYGRAAVVELVLQHGFDVNTQLAGHGQGHKGLHVAALYAHLDVVDVLLRHGAEVDPIDETWHAPPLEWALTGWSRKQREAEDYYAVVARLVSAGAKVTPDLLEWDKARADAKMLS